ncbi:MAG: hypothetical protein ACI9NC_001875, partial [Verrucomicrobiales bacterium]
RRISRPRGIRLEFMEEGGISMKLNPCQKA